MNATVQALFPDTNVFIQCRPLEDLDWSRWNNHEEVHLIVCRAVLREIDNLKNRTDARVAKRARQAYRRLRAIVTGEDDHAVIKDGQPIVKLYLSELSQPSAELKSILDYSKPDDELVGYAHRYAAETPDRQVAVLTHDTGPMLTAKNVGLDFEAVQESWLIPAQHGAEDKEKRKLIDRIDELERAEPTFNIHLVDGTGKLSERLEIEYTVYRAMPQAEVDSLLDTLRSKYPVASDFGHRDARQRNAQSVTSGVFNVNERYIPASKAQISEYTDRQYPSWLQSCEDNLLSLHKALQRTVKRPTFAIAISNDGSRPARDALVEVSAAGNFLLMIEPDADADDSASDDLGIPPLPPPPEPPRGKWESDYAGYSSLARGIEQLGSLGNILDMSARIPVGMDSMIPILSSDSARDPNRFYYKPHRPNDPGIDNQS